MTRRMLTLATLLPILALAAPASTVDHGTYQGRSAEWWAHKTTHWKRAAVRRGRTLAFVKRRALRTHGPTLSHGIELAAVAYGQSDSALRRVAFCESRFYLYARSSRPKTAWASTG